MLRSTSTSLAKPINKNWKRRLWGVPGVPMIRTERPRRVAHKYRHDDIVVTFNASRKSNALLHYLGKHSPHPQKSLWSPDTPVMQDRHMFMLTTLDIDAFKYWFGVKRARLSPGAWKIISKSGLLPPSFFDSSPLHPKPIFDKEELYKYYLKNRKPLEVEEKNNYIQYRNSMIKSEADKSADRPVAPWL